MRALERAIDAVAKGPLSPALYGGFTGVAWSVAHLQEGLLDPDDDPNESIDVALIRHLSRSPWRLEYDLISGLVGFGVYALERLPRAAAAEILSLVIERLDETAECRPDGITWFSRPEWFIPKTRTQYPGGYYNLGVAHGVPGVIALLAGARAAGVAARKAGSLLDGAVRWLLAQEMKGDAVVRFASFFGPDLEPARSRLAWCYGDLGVAAALLSAARLAGEPAWEREALATARIAAARPPDQAGVIDAGLCHGAAGVAHLFNRLFQATREGTFRDAAVFWYERTLDLRLPEGGVAGYRAWGPDQAGVLGWRDERGFLTGAAGIALALIAAVSCEEPAWDRMLLPSPPARALGGLRS